MTRGEKAAVFAYLMIVEHLKTVAAHESRLRERRRAKIGLKQIRKWYEEGLKHGQALALHPE